MASLVAPAFARHRPGPFEAWSPPGCALRDRLLSLHSRDVGEGTGRSLQVAPPGGSPDSTVDEGGLEDVASVDEAISRTPFDVGRRRFTIATLIAMGLTAIPFIWILWSDWGPPTLFRQAEYEDNFFDLQARRHVPRPSIPAQRSSRTRGFRARRTDLYLLRPVRLHHPDADPPDHQQPGRKTHHYLHTGRLVGRRAVHRTLTLEGPLPPAWRRCHGQDGGDGLRDPDGRHHGRLGLDGAGGHSLRLR